MSSLWDKARAAAGQARLLFAANEYDGACSRAYYAMFNTARALLASRGIDPAKTKTHKTVHRIFSLHFVENAIFDEDDGRALRRVSESRNIADYDTVELGRARAQAIMESMEKFMATAEKVMRDAAREEREP